MKRLYYSEADREKLIEQKEKIMKEFREKITKLQNKNSEFLNNAPRNPKIKFNLDLNVLDKIKGLFNWESSKDLIVRPEDAMQYMEMWFKRDREIYEKTIQTLDNDHKSLLKNIDKAIADTDSELQQLRADLKEIDKKLMADPDNEALRKQANETRRRKFET